MQLHDWWLQLMADTRESLADQLKVGDLEPTVRVLLDTDFPNLFFNTITAPFLILATWRGEPTEEPEDDGESLRFPGSPERTRSELSIVPDEDYRPLMLVKPDVDREWEELIEETITFIMNLSVNAILEVEGL